MRDYLYWLAQVFLIIGLGKALVFNHRMPKSRTEDVSEAVVNGFRDMDKSLRVAIPWWIAGLATAMLAGLF